MTSWIANTDHFANASGMHDGDVGFGWWLVTTLGMLGFWGAVSAVVVWPLRGGASSSRVPPVPPGDVSAREILDRHWPTGRSTSRSTNVAATCSMTLAAAPVRIASQTS